MKRKNKTKKKNVDPELTWLYEDTPTADSGKAIPKGRGSGRSLRQAVSYGIRSVLAVIICIGIPVFWYFGGDFSGVSSSTTEAIDGFFDTGQPVTANPPALFPFKEIEPGLTAYAGKIKKAPYADKFSMVEITTLHNSEVPVDYLDRLHEAGYLEGLSLPAVLTYFRAGITTDYLDQLREGGYLERFSYPAIIAFYSKEITADFLKELQEKGLLDELSFAEILIMYDQQENRSIEE